MYLEVRRYQFQIKNQSCDATSADMWVSYHKLCKQKLFKTMDAEKDKGNDGGSRSSRYGKLHLDELLDFRVRKQKSCSWKLCQPAEYFISTKGADSKKKYVSVIFGDPQLCK